MTIPRLHDLQAYWRKHPPTHYLVAAYLGYEGQEAGTDAGALEDFKAAWLALGGRLG